MSKIQPHVIALIAASAVRTRLAKLLKRGRMAWMLAKALPRVALSSLRRFRFPRSAERLLTGLTRPHATAADYDALVSYMALSWHVYRNEAGSGARFFGYPSWSGQACDELEAFSRMMPLFAAWCASGRDPDILFPGASLSPEAEFKRGLLAGTDPRSRFYWGPMPGKSNQRIVEAADVALSLWLMRKSVWAELSCAERGQVADWLALVDGKAGLDNNWHLFFVLIDRVLSSLGHSGRIRDARKRFERVKHFHVGSGWFSDGPNGPVDYYNAWGFHYALTWIDRIDRDWDPAFIHAVQRQFLKTYRLMIGPEGFPVFGRSIPYRLAAAAPLVAAVERYADVIPAGEARRALDSTWRYFIRKGAIYRGTFTQGYFKTDVRLLDAYSGPASSLWSLRSLVMAFYYPADHAFWTADATSLPIETGSFDVFIPGLEWRVEGSQTSTEIRVEILANPKKPFVTFEKLSWKDSIMCYSGLGHRPANREMKYGLRYYSSCYLFFEGLPTGVMG